MISRQYSFDQPDENDNEDEDEFMQYYRKYRPPVPGSLQGSQASSSPICSLNSDRSSLRDISSVRSLTLKARRFFKPKKIGMPKSRSLEEEQGSTASSSNQGLSRNGSINTSPLGGLTGLLSDKMTFSGTSSGFGDDSQSRDSGHSSGGSPDLRGLRKRRSAPPLHNRAFKNLYDRDWYRQHQPQPRAQASHGSGSNFSDRQSLYSYTTAREASSYYDPQYPEGEEDSYWNPRDSRNSGDPRASYYASSRASVCSGQSGRISSHHSELYDSYPEMPLTESSRMSIHDNQRSQSAQLDMYGRHHKRKLDCLCEDNGSVINGGPCNKRPCTPNGSLRSDESVHHPSKSHALKLWCSRLCMVIKTVLMGLSLCLLFFGCFFVWRSYRCESDRQREFDSEALARSMNEELFGQSVAKDTILKSIQEFTSQNYSVITLIMTGWLGSGKTFASNLIQTHFPNPENVHLFTVPLHFADGTRNFHFLDDLSLHISRSCGHSLVIFDDIDGGSQSTTEQVEKFILTLKNSQLSSRSNGTLVLITSNVGGQALNQMTLALMREDIALREALDLNTMTQAIRDNGYIVPTLDALQDQGIPVKVIPFLPLTREHVRQCVEKEIARKGYPSTVQDIEKILGEMRFFTDDFPVLSKSGCKTVANKVNLFLSGHDPYFHG